MSLADMFFLNYNGPSITRIKKNTRATWAAPCGGKNKCRGSPSENVPPSKMRTVKPHEICIRSIKNRWNTEWSIIPPPLSLSSSYTHTHTHARAVGKTDRTKKWCDAFQGVGYRLTDGWLDWKPAGSHQKPGKTQSKPIKPLDKTDEEWERKKGLERHWMNDRTRRGSSEQTRNFLGFLTNKPMRSLREKENTAETETPSWDVKTRTSSDARWIKSESIDWIVRMQIAKNSSNIWENKWLNPSYGAPVGTLSQIHLAQSRTRKSTEANRKKSATKHWKQTDEIGAISYDKDPSSPRNRPKLKVEKTRNLPTG